jgi:hypothetical protein
MKVLPGEPSFLSLNPARFLFTALCSARRALLRGKAAKPEHERASPAAGEA